jgi:hypothetical protein
MSELEHSFGNDLTLTAAGDLALVTGVQEGQERVLRRLLTNPGANIWQLNYGGGLGQIVGTTTATQTIQALIFGQMQLENVVDQTVPPSVAVIQNPDGSTLAAIQYTDANTGQTFTLPAPLS